MCPKYCSSNSSFHRGSRAVTKNGFRGEERGGEIAKENVIYQLMLHTKYKGKKRVYSWEKTYFL